MAYGLGFTRSSQNQAGNIPSTNTVAQHSTIYLPIITTIDYSVPQTTIRTVHAPYFSSSNVIPDHIREMSVFWYGRVEANDVYTDVRVGYNDTALFVRTQTFDRLLWYDTNRSLNDITKFDSVSLVLDTSPIAGGAPSPSSYRFAAELDPETWLNNPLKRAYRGDGTNWAVSPISFSAESGWRGEGYNSTNSEARGWSMDFQIPFSSLGISGPPPVGTTWRLGFTTYNRNDAQGTPLPSYTWPETLSESNQTSWGDLQFGLVRYSSPPTPPAGTTIIRNRLNGATVIDAAVGGTIDAGGSGDHLCPGDSNFIWNQWGNTNFAGAETFNIQNQSDVADWPCFAKYYLTFPLDQIPAGKAILSAKLTLYQMGGSDPAQAYSSLIQVFTVRDNWSESSISWNNAPLALENVGQTVVTPTVFPGWPGIPWNWDVSWAVTQAYASANPVLRLAMYSADAAIHSGKYFVSSDMQDWNAIARPTLTITWGNR